jgi:Flp pilus assembly protein TadD
MLLTTNRVALISLADCATAVSLATDLDRKREMDRRKTADVLFYALQCAKSDRLSYADATDGDEREKNEALADVRAFERLQTMIFGTSESELDIMTKKMNSFSIHNVKQMLEEHPEIFNHAEGCECQYCTSNLSS